MTHIEWSRVSLFKDLTESELAKLRPIFERISIPAGQPVIREGDPGDEMYVLIKGRVRVTKSMLLKGVVLPLAELSGTRKTLATIDASVYPTFGEMALLDRDTRSATVECLVDSDFLHTDRARFFDLIEREPVIGCRLLAVIGRRLTAMVRRGNEDSVKLTTALALALGRREGLGLSKSGPTAT